MLMIPMQRVWLRRIEREDIPLLCDWSRSDELAFFNAFTSNKPRAAFEREYEQNIGSSSLMDYLIISGDNETPVGFCGLKDINWVDRHAELFISVCNEQARREGLATIAILMLVKIAFFEQNLNKLVFSVSEHNERILNLIRKWGFRHEGTMREMHYFNNVYYDLQIFGILRREAEQFFQTAFENVSTYLFPNAGREVLSQVFHSMQNIMNMSSSPGEVQHHIATA
jgi:RimJ/RimL family protein N-acetyltransferase